MTRAAYATALCRLMGWELVTPEKGSFTDNQDTVKWYYSAIGDGLCPRRIDGREPSMPSE